MKAKWFVRNIILASMHTLMISATKLAFIHLINRTNYSGGRGQLYKRALATVSNKSEPTNLGLPRHLFGKFSFHPLAGASYI